MKIVKWILLSAAAFGAGLFAVQFLVVHPLRMSLYLTLTLLLLGAAAVMITVWFRGWSLVTGIPLALVLAFGGYLVMTAIVLSQEDTREVPPLLRKPGEPGNGHTAVIYFTHGEPSTYNPIGWLNQFREFDRQGIAFIPFPARPLFLNALRTAYLRVGRSDHRFIHQQMLASLEREFRLSGDTATRFYLSFLDDEPRPDAAVVRALNEGADRIILTEVFLTISNHTAEGEELVEALEVEKRFGVEVRHTGPLWDSPTLRRMFVERVNAHLDGVDRKDTAVLLVGHGQSDEWDAEWGTETEQELSFREGILDLLEQEGFRRDLLDLAWMDFKEPKPAPRIEQFVQAGARKLLYFAAAMSADALHSQYDIPELVHRARVPETFSMENLGGWNNDPMVIQAIRERIEEQMHKR